MTKKRLENQACSSIRFFTWPTLQLFLHFSSPIDTPWRWDLITLAETRKQAKLTAEVARSSKNKHTTDQSHTKFRAPGRTGTMGLSRRAYTLLTSHPGSVSNSLRKTSRANSQEELFVAQGLSRGGARRSVCAERELVFLYTISLVHKRSCVRFGHLPARGRRGAGLLHLKGAVERIVARVTN